jgi:hypothetical protein
LLTASIQIALGRFLLVAYFGIFEITVPQAKRRQQRVCYPSAGDPFSWHDLQVRLVYPRIPDTRSTDQ